MKFDVCVVKRVSDGETFYSIRYLAKDGEYFWKGESVNTWSIDSGNFVTAPWETRCEEVAEAYLKSDHLRYGLCLFHIAKERVLFVQSDD